MLYQEKIWQTWSSVASLSPDSRATVKLKRRHQDYYGVFVTAKNIKNWRKIPFYFKIF
jgi:hypothetical protein